MAWAKFLAAEPERNVAVEGLMERCTLRSLRGSDGAGERKARSLSKHVVVSIAGFELLLGPTVNSGR